MLRRPPSSTLFPTRRSSDLRFSSIATNPPPRRRRPASQSWPPRADRKSTRLNSSHEWISYAVFCLKKKKGKECRSARRQLSLGVWCLKLAVGVRSLDLSAHV